MFPWISNLPSWQQMSAKDIETAHLVKLHAEYKQMYEEMRSMLRQEVKVYNRLILPEMDRISG